MIIKTLSEVNKSQRAVEWGNGVSRRLILEEDKMGYAVTDTIVNPNTESILEYKNHLETCYCIEGNGEIEDLDCNIVYPINPGTIYALDKHDKHILRAKTQLRLVCVFNPPLKGYEKHSLSFDKSSNY